MADAIAVIEEIGRVGTDEDIIDFLQAYKYVPSIVGFHIALSIGEIDECHQTLFYAFIRGLMQGSRHAHLRRLFRVIPFRHAVMACLEDYAFFDGDVEVARMLIGDGYSSTALFRRACRVGDLEVVRYFIEEKDASIAMGVQETAEAGQVDCLKELIGRGHTLTEADVFAGCRSGSKKVVKRLLPDEYHPYMLDVMMVVMVTNGAREVIRGESLRIVGHLIQHTITHSYLSRVIERWTLVLEYSHDPFFSMIMAGFIEGGSPNDDGVDYVLAKAIYRSMECT